MVYDAMDCLIGKNMAYDIWDKLTKTQTRLSNLFWCVIGCFFKLGDKYTPIVDMIHERLISGGEKKIANIDDIITMVKKQEKDILSSNKITKQEKKEVAERISIAIIRTDEEFQKYYPARTKTDLSIRRTRYEDLALAYKKRGKTGELKNGMIMLATFDYISCLNILWANLLVDNWMKNMYLMGCFDYGLDYYIELSKLISTIAKNSDMIGPEITYYIECQSLCGYRNPPFTNFSVMEQSKKLADSGNEHPLKELFFEEVKKLEVFESVHEYISLYNWIREGKWDTAGSSSFGKIEIDGKLIKCRKNTLLFVYTVEELYSLIIDFKPINKVVVKSELTKNRIAVASDLGTYFLMTWVNYLAGDFEHNWTEIAYDETYSSEKTRIMNFLELNKNKSYALPYDFQEFDHQPTKDELLALLELKTNMMWLKVPEESKTRDSALLEKLKYSVTNAKLAGTEGDKKFIFDVNGGVLSGWFFTSYFGNGWNLGQSNTACSIISSLGLSPPKKFIKGDDCVFFCDSKDILYLFVAIMEANEMKTSKGKFSLHKGCSEFLRIRYSDKAYGYVMRTIPGLTQRKPWSNQPWTDDVVLNNLYSTVNTIERRHGNTACLMDTFIERWCALKNVNKQIIHIPRERGGFGIPPLIEDLIVKKEKRVEKETFITAKYLPERRMLELSRAGIPCSKQDLINIATSELNTTLAADDIPAVSKILRAKANKRLRKLKTTKIREKGYAYHETEVNVTQGILSNMTQKDNAALTRFMPCSYGSKRKYNDVINSAKEILVQTKGKLLDWMKTTLPDLYIIVKQHRSWSVNFCLDWFLGNLSQEPEMNPKLHSLTFRIACQTGNWRNYMPGNVLYSVIRQRYSKYAAAVTSCEYYRDVYCW